MLVPFMLEKLPNTIKLQISRKLERENEKQKNFCQQLIRKLLQEKILKIKKKTVSIAKKKAQFLLPVYCMPEQDWKSVCFVSVKFISHQCRIFSDIDTRGEILKKGNIYFKCLKNGHCKEICQTKIKCFLCKVEGNHHTALPKNRSIQVPITPILMKIIVA